MFPIDAISLKYKQCRCFFVQRIYRDLFPFAYSSHIFPVIFPMRSATAGVSFVVRVVGGKCPSAGITLSGND